MRKGTGTGTRTTGTGTKKKMRENEEGDGDEDWKNNGKERGEGESPETLRVIVYIWGGGRVRGGDANIVANWYLSVIAARPDAPAIMSHHEEG